MKDINYTLNPLKSVINDQDTILVSIERVENLEERINELHTKIDTLLETLSDKFDKLEYSGHIVYGEPHHIGRQEKSINVKLRRTEKEIASPNPHGDDDYATPEDVDIFPGP